MPVDIIKAVPRNVDQATSAPPLAAEPASPNPIEWVTLRRATEEDAGALALVGAATFLEAFTWMLPGADIVAHCSRNHTPQAYASYLRQPSTQIHMALAGPPRGYPEQPPGAPVGYAMLAAPELPSFDVLPTDIELKRIYLFSRFRRAPVVNAGAETSSTRTVLPGHRSESAAGGELSTLPHPPRIYPGQALLNAAIRDAVALGRTRLLLGTHAGNLQAIAFYRRNGFIQAGTRTFQVGAQTCQDLIFARPL